jgi:hypothetical protein
MGRDQKTRLADESATQHARRLAQGERWMKWVVRFWLGGSLIGLLLAAAGPAQAVAEGAGDTVPGASWATLYRVGAKKDVVPGIRRPEMVSYTQSYAYGPNSGFGSEVTFRVHVDDNNYDEPVTLYLIWEDRVSGQKRYYNTQGGSFGTTEVDLFGTAGSPIRVFVPELDAFEFFGPNGAFGALTGVPTATGQYQLVFEIRDHEGSAVVNFTNAMFNFVDGIQNHNGDLGASQTWEARFVHYLAAPTFVQQGATLTIEPGTVILGSTGGQGLLGVRGRPDPGAGHRPAADHLHLGAAARRSRGR